MQKLEWYFLSIEQKHRIELIFLETFNCFEILFIYRGFALTFSSVTILS